LRRQFSQLVVDERQEMLSSVQFALFDGRQDAGDLAHSGEHNRQRHDWQGSDLIGRGQDRLFLGVIIT
jgi:hypothetical protein